jgi:hypothetical protein
VPTRPFEEPPAAAPPGGAVVTVSTGVGVAGSVAGGVLLCFEVGFVVCLAFVGVTEWPGLFGAVPFAVPVA